MAEPTTQEAQVDIPVKGKLIFGKDGINFPTPKWAIKVFRAVLYAVFASKMLCMIISEIPPSVGSLIDHYGIEVVAIVHLVSRLMGIKPQDYEISFESNS